MTKIQRPCVVCATPIYTASNTSPQKAICVACKRQGKGQEKKRPKVKAKVKEKPIPEAKPVKAAPVLTYAPIPLAVCPWECGGIEPVPYGGVF